MIDIKKKWFNSKSQIINIKCPTINLLKNKEEALCYLITLKTYPKLEPKHTIYAWITENNNQTGYLIITGDNAYTTNHQQFKFTKEGK